MKIFGSNEGKLVALESSSSGVPAIIRVPGLNTQSVLITGIGFSEGANVQFSQTLKDKIYVYSFGERMGQMEVQGMIFWRTCSTASSGFIEVLKYYKANTVSENEKPLHIAIGGSSSGNTIRAFLTDVDLRASDPERGIGSFTLRLAGLPVT